MSDSQTSPTESYDLQWVKKEFFSDPEKVIELKKGEVLFNEREHNHRLYLILKGSVAGYISDGSGSDFKVFESYKDKFVGVYSFFSEERLSYAKVVAQEDTKLAYVDSRQEILNKGDLQSYVRFFVSLIVNELISRQYFARKMAIEKEITLKKLMHTDKMATLGQMAAGLAHELNNAVGVLQRKTEWLSEVIPGYLKEKDRHNNYRFFELGKEKGQFLSSSEVRNRKKEIEKKFKVSSNMAKKLARTGLTDKDLEEIGVEKEEHGNRMYHYWEIGSTFYDMELAARHATHVVKSVKQLGVTDHPIEQGVKVNDTINEALALLKSLLRNIKVEVKLEDLPEIRGSSGELVQIWVNIIKNAAEALISSDTKNQTIWVSSETKDKFIIVRIIDNGPGIPKEVRNRIFQPNVTTKIGGLSFGLGLGLSIVDRIVAGHEGEIEVNSKPGKTEFKILIPIR